MAKREFTSMATMVDRGVCWPQEESEREVVKGWEKVVRAGRQVPVGPRIAEVSS